MNEFSKSYERFIIIDEDTIYNLGALLKQLGKKWFAFSEEYIHQMT